MVQLDRHQAVGATGPVGCGAESAPVGYPDQLNE